MADILSYDMPLRDHSIIKVIGVGGGGSNAVNYMYGQGIKGVDFVICNTDNQALDASPIQNKIRLGESLTEGMGAGSKPEVGKDAAIESLPEIEQILGGHTKMVFITAGMGGGTGTGAAPIIAKVARDKGMLTVGIVTIPFVFEGQKRIDQALDGVEALQENVDALLVINNERLKDMFGNLGLSKAFAHADSVLSTAAKGIAEIITIPGYVNVDFKDVRTVMRDSGVAIMGSGKAKGENRALAAVEQAVNSPLLNENEIRGAKQMLLHIISGKEEITMDEVTKITDYLTERVGDGASIIWGTGYDESLDENVGVTLIATGFSFRKPGAKSAAKAIPEEEENEIVKKTISVTLDDEDDAKLNEGLYSDSNGFANNQDDGVFTSNGGGAHVAPGNTIEFDVPKPNPCDRMSQYYQKPKSNDNRPEVVVDQYNIEMPRYNVNLGNVGNLDIEQMEDEKYIEQLESIPAYARKKVRMQKEDTPEVSKFSIKQEHGQITFNDKNSFLHDNVD